MTLGGIQNGLLRGCRDAAYRAPVLDHGRGTPDLLCCLADVAEPTKNLCDLGHGRNVQ